MATVEKTIKTGGDYSTIAAWEEDLDESSIYSSGDTAVGLVSGDHEIGTKITFNSGGTVGLVITRLSVPEADRHDGTAGSGVTLTISTSSNYCFEATNPSGEDVRRVVEWLEWDYEDTDHGGDEWISVGSGGGSTIDRAPVFSHNLVHDVDCGSNIGRIVQVGGWWSATHNNILYTVRSTSSAYCHGLQCNERISAVANNTVYDVATTGSGANARGLKINSELGYLRCFNNISVGTAGTSAADWDGTWTGSTIGANNLSSDSTAPGGDEVHGEAAADLFVSTSGGSEDLHLKGCAAAVGAGADLGTSVTVYGNAIASSTTGTAVNFDIDNRDRVAEWDTWDIGADQRVSPIVTKTIKSGGDYTSPSAWAADLDDSSIYGCGDTAVGECSGEHELTTELILNGGGTVGLVQTRITAPTADRHDGTAGSGTRWTSSSTGTKIFRMSHSVASVQRTCEWIEFDFEDTVRSGDEWIYITQGLAEGTGRLCNFSHNLLHDMDAGSSPCRLVWAETYCNALHNNIVYNVTSTSTNFVYGINHYFYNSLSSNNTVYNVSGPDANGIYYYSRFSSGAYDNNDAYNNISVGTSGTGSADFGGYAANRSSNNLSSDSSAPGSDAVTGESAADLFVSTSAGSEDLHLKSGAAAIGAGVDLGTSYTVDVHGGITVGMSRFGTALNFDIDNYDREDADDWDIGADQRVAAAASALPVAMNTYQQMMRGR